MRLRAGFVSIFLVLWVLMAVILLSSNSLSLSAQSTRSGDLPPGFVREMVVEGLDGPTAFAMAPDGRIYFTQKAGAVKVFHAGRLLRENFIDLSAEVNQAYNRGLVGITLHPDFPKTPFVYLAYVYQPKEANQHKETGARLSRIVRVTADPDNLNRALPGSTFVLLGGGGTYARIGNPDRSDAPPLTCEDANGAPVHDCVPVEGTAHQINAMRFGADGALYVAVGDGGEHARAGQRAQDVNSLSGKILRINPITGAGYANNPFYDRNPLSNRSKVFALGLRNPFRLTIAPATGELFIGDVGAATWEEVNRGRRGANFGWPCFEGPNVAGKSEFCAALHANPTRAIFPVHAYEHTDGRVAVVGGDFDRDGAFPDEYRNAYFFADYNAGVIWAMTVATRTVEVVEFARGFSGVVQITAGNDGDLYVLSIRTGALERVTYAE